MMHGQQLFQYALQFVEVKRIRAIGFCLCRIVVDFKEDAVDSCGYCGTGEDRDELRLTAADAITR